MFVLGTAGHVDHGKSALVQALTGIDPDRLPEEKTRGLTIDLGFAWFNTSDGTPIGIVDVPGHERFVKNMIAGVGAIDFVLFVVAADDGWMPQSTEHLDILRFLDIKHGLVAVTKADLAAPDWLELVVDDIKDKTADTFLAGVPVVPVSAVTGEGINTLQAEIESLVTRIDRRKDIGRPRLYLDRAFTIAGRGSVVTGTLIEGSLTVGDEVVLVPSANTARVRELQSHKQKVDAVGPGRRVAANLSGVERGELARGECLVRRDDADTYSFVIVSLSLLAESRWSIKTGRVLLALLGTAEPEATCRLLDTEEIKPGTTALCELRLAHPIKARIGDRFVLRLPTPEITIGGGQILDFPAYRITPSNTQYLELLRRRFDDLSLAIILNTEMEKHQWLAKSAVPSDIRFSNTEVAETIAEFLATGAWREIGGGYLSTELAERHKERALNILKQRHQEVPYAYGYNEIEWRNRVKIPGELFRALINSWLAEGSIKVKDGQYHLPDFRPTFPTAWKDEAAKLKAMVEQGGMSPPTRSELEAESDNAGKIINMWVTTGEMVSLPDGIIYPTNAIDEIIEKIKQHCGEHGSITVAQARDLLDTTRKYTVPILTYTDDRGLTKREGDIRVWVG